MTSSSGLWPFSGAPSKRSRLSQFTIAEPAIESDPDTDNEDNSTAEGSPGAPFINIQEDIWRNTELLGVPATKFLVPEFEYVYRSRVHLQKVSTYASQSTLVKFTVYASPTEQQVYWMKKRILAQNSGYFRDQFSNNTEPLAVVCESMSTFQDFVDYMHSNVFHVNTRTRNFQAVRAYISAWTLGAELGAYSYQTAALFKLHVEVDPATKVVPKHAATCPIGIEDADSILKGRNRVYSLNAIVMDAIAAYWTQEEVIALTKSYTPEPELKGFGGREQDVTPGRPAEPTWEKLYATYSLFRNRMESSTKVEDNRRCYLLRPFYDYVMGYVEPIETEVEEEAEDVSQIDFARETSSRQQLLVDRKMEVEDQKRKRRNSSVSSQKAQPWVDKSLKEVDEDIFMMEYEA